MKTDYENQYHQLEETHWWLTSRRNVVRRLVLHASSDRNCRILEIGCSGGKLIGQLHDDGYSRITGIDISPSGIEICRSSGLMDTHVMDASKLSFDDESFDVITASDVLEHLPNALEALREWRRVLKPEGTLIVFVPAFQLLWSKHDELNKHYQRYRRWELRRVMSEAGLQVTRSSYWNFVLFWPVTVIRLLRRLFPEGETFAGDIRPTPALTNRALSLLLNTENFLMLHGLNFPVGVSVMAVARRDAAGNQVPLP